MANSAAESKKRTERIRVFIRMLKQNEYPNFGSLKKQLEQEFKGKYEFTRQTMYRDVEYLKNLGANIEFDHKEHNGYYLMNNNWSGYASFLDEDEMEAAVLGAQFAERILPPSPLRDKIRVCVDSLWAEHSLPDEDSEIQWNSLVVQGLPVRIDPNVFQIVFEQWRSQHDVDIVYTPVNSGRKHTVTIEPHVLTFFNGTWYVRGKAISPDKPNPTHNNFLTFALHRISEAKRNGKLFEPDLKEIAAVNKGRTFDFPLNPDVRLKASGRALRQALEVLPVKRAEFSAADCAELELAEVEEYKVINFVLVSEGCVTIMAPESLKAKALMQAQAVVKCLE